MTPGETGSFEKDWIFNGIGLGLIPVPAGDLLIVLFVGAVGSAAAMVEKTASLGVPAKVGVLSLSLVFSGGAAGSGFFIEMSLTAGGFFAATCTSSFFASFLGFFLAH